MGYVGETGHMWVRQAVCVGEWRPCAGERPGRVWMKACHVWVRWATCG